MREKIKHTLFTTLGLFFVLLGIIGAFLPVMPTTVFLIIALFFFAESSPKFHAMLLNNRYVGEDLRRWDEKKTMKRETKIKASWIILISFSISMTLVYPHYYLDAFLLGLGLLFLGIIWIIKEEPAEVPATEESATERNTAEKKPTE